MSEKYGLSPFLWGFLNWTKFKVIKSNIQGPIQPCCKRNKCNLVKTPQKGEEPKDVLEKITPLNVVEVSNKKQMLQTESPKKDVQKQAPKRYQKQFRWQRRRLPLIKN